LPKRINRIAGPLLVGAILAGTLTAASLDHTGARSSQLALNAGTAWFAEPTTGTASLMDGSTASRVSQQSVAPPRHTIEVVQDGSPSGSGAFVVDHTSGTVARIDGATLQPGTGRRFGPHQDNKLAVVSGLKATWVVAQGGTLVEQVDPTSLVALGPPQPLSGAGAPLLLPDGSLWAAGGGGVVESFANGLPHSRSRPASVPFTLLAANDKPVLAEASVGKILVLDAHGEAAREIPFNPPESNPLLSGSADAPYVTAVGPHSSILEVVNLQDERMASLALGDPSPAVARFGPPVSKGDLIFVPDLLQGVVIVARVQRDQLSLVGQVAVGLGEPFRLFSHDNHIWFDDPVGNTAGVITDDLTAIAIAKVGGDGQGRQVGHVGPVHMGPAIRPEPGNLTSPPPPNNNFPGLPPGGNKGSTKGKAGGDNGGQSGQAGNNNDHTGNQNDHSGNSGGNGSSGDTSNSGNSQRGTLANPTFAWSPAQPRAGQIVTFVDTTTGSHRIYHWVFDQGTPASSTATAPGVAWQQPGTYMVTLTITSHGASASVQHQITITATTGTKAALAWSPTEPVAGQIVTFRDVSAGPHQIEAWHFSHASPSDSTAGSPQVRWQNPGQYPVTLTITGGDGSRQSTSRTITVAPAPPTVQASFSVSPDLPVVGSPVTFTDTSVGPVHRVQWTFDQGAPPSSATTSPQVTWASPGSYAVTLAVFAANGSHSSVRHEVNVTPKAAFTSSTETPLVGQVVTFTDGSVGPHQIVQWQFQDGDPPSSSNATPTVTWHTSGTHTAELTVSGTGPASSLKASASQILNVALPPTPTFAVSPSQPVAGQPVTFTDTTPGGPYQDTWSFQDVGGRTGTSATVAWPLVSSAVGYQVRLTIAAPGNTSPQPGETNGATQAVSVVPHALPGADCISYPPGNLAVVNLGAQGWRLQDGNMAMELLDNSSDAQAALQLAQPYSQQCFIGRNNTRANRLDYIADYWMGGGPAPTLSNQDCISYDPGNLTLSNLGSAGWELVEGNMWMERLDNSADAQASLQLAQQYNQQCFIGRNNTRSDRLDYIVEYWKTA
jgi:PKD repeat protein